MTTEKIGKKEIQIIHVAKSQLMMTDEEYRAVLRSVGVSTSKDLTYPQYEKLLCRFRADGFILTAKKHSGRKDTKASWDKEPMLKKIGALLAAMGLSWKYADSIAKHMFKVDLVSWCAPEQLHSVIAALEYKRRKVACESVPSGVSRGL
jgi:phage gp16-like protein